jgi:hypothetical protein
MSVGVGGTYCSRDRRNRVLGPAVSAPEPQEQRRAAAEYLREQRGIPCKTLAKLACIGGGPVYGLFGRIPLYTSLDLDAYADSKLGKPVRSTSEYGDERGTNHKASVRFSDRQVAGSVAV